MSRDSYDADYEASRIQTFISKFKDSQIKKLNKKWKKQEDRIEKLTGHIKMCYLFDWNWKQIWSKN